LKLGYNLLRVAFLIRKRYMAINGGRGRQGDNFIHCMAQTSLSVALHILFIFLKIIKSQCFFIARV
jgi:hypothetical protein